MRLGGPLGEAAEGADLATAEGRSRMLAQARPLWAALPDGALRRQLLPELARRAQLELPDLAALWGGAAVGARGTAVARSPATVPPPGGRAPMRSAGRRAPADSADLALRLLLRHSDWWQQLSPDDHSLLHELGGPHAPVIAWLEQQLTEHGPLTWAALEEAMTVEPWHAQARAWVDAADPEEAQDLDDLRRVLQRLWIARLGEQAHKLVATGPAGDDEMARLRAIHEQIARLKAALAAPAA